MLLFLVLGYFHPVAIALVPFDGRDEGNPKPKFTARRSEGRSRSRRGAEV